ncbi:MAG: haloacid dehalogenase, type [Ramlibacter sp.]|jgi:2-haloacid dehalogenase|nr:haloacid dehalogenase, type [Ramlibacter sp.]
MRHYAERPLPRGGAHAYTATMQSTLTWKGAGDVEVLAFDIFGTVVDWHGSISREMQALYPQVDGAGFATAWRAGYRPAMARVMSGELGWLRIDDLHRMILDEILPQFGLQALDEPARRHLNLAWHRLDPWPDAVAGLVRLKRRYLITTLSNGNIGLLTHMAKRAGLPWDCILSAEVFRAYKPDPATYLGVARVFDVAPERVMLVAAHHDDLEGARRCGLRTAYVERPLEFGRDAPKDVSPRGENDLHSRSLVDLAEQLGC